MSKSKKNNHDNQIITNKKAFHDYFFEEHFEAGLSLEGWEVKALRAGRVQLKDAHVLIKGGEIYLFGTTITPLPAASTHILADPMRTRKLLLHRREIDKLIGTSQRDGYTLIPVSLYWKNSRIKLNVAVAKGKKEYDKRAVSKDREWQLDKARLMKNKNLER
ncbi:MAG: SsrA-binding protein SmpB [Cardiobacteriaceae bacterium]|nr:SsrA-binding protein SmpB [Cardiobacteriaceae bacterium]